MEVPPEPEFTFGEPSAPPSVEPEARAVPPENRVAPGEIANLDDRSAAPADKAPNATELARAPAPKPMPEPAAKPAPELALAPASQPATQKPAQPERPAAKAEAPNRQVAAGTPPAAPPVEKPQTVATLQPSSPATTLSPAAPSSSARTEPSSDSALMAWAVQVGSFSEHENATTLRDQLRAAGFAAFEERAISDGEEVYRVKVGPEFNRARAEDLQARLRVQQDLQGIVVSHPPASSSQVLRGGG